MNDDKKLTAYIAGCCLAGALLVLIAASIFVPAHAAALLDMDGKKIVVLTGDEFVATMKGKDDEVAALKAKLEAQHKAECNLI